MKLEWQLESRIRTYEVRADGRARIAAICNLLQECAGIHADQLGIGVELLRTRGMIWALARIGMEIQRLPSVGEQIVVQTWLQGVRGPFAMREFAVFDQASSLLARASYAWLAIDVETRRTVRPGELLAALPHKPDRTSLDARLGKIQPPVAPAVLDPIHTRVSDLDMQNHVNNTRYVAWIEDALDGDLKGALLTWLQVNFIAEAAAGERIEVYSGTPPEGREGFKRVVALSRDGTDIVRAGVIF